MKVVVVLKLNKTRGDYYYANRGRGYIQYPKRVFQLR